MEDDIEQLEVEVIDKRNVPPEMSRNEKIIGAVFMVCLVGGIFSGILNPYPLLSRADAYIQRYLIVRESLEAIPAQTFAAMVDIHAIEEAKKAAALKAAKEAEDNARATKEARENRAKFDYARESGATVVSHEWTKEGFGSVFVLTKIRIKNTSTFDLKDFRVVCRVMSKSGTQIGMVSGMIYEKVAPGKTITFRDINLGFINSQAATSNCMLLKWDVEWS